MTRVHFSPNAPHGGPAGDGAPPPPPVQVAVVGDSIVCANESYYAQMLGEYLDAGRVEATRTCEIEAGDALYLGLFKGGVYSYDKRKKQGVLLYLPPYQYDWPVALALDGKVLTIKLRDDDVVRYDLETHEFTREGR